MKSLISMKMQCSWHQLVTQLKNPRLNAALTGNGILPVIRIGI